MGFDQFGGFLWITSGGRFVSLFPCVFSCFFNRIILLFRAFFSSFLFRFCPLHLFHSTYFVNTFIYGVLERWIACRERPVIMIIDYIPTLLPCVRFFQSIQKASYESNDVNSMTTSRLSELERACGVLTQGVRPFAICFYPLIGVGLNQSRIGGCPSQNALKLVKHSCSCLVRASLSCPPFPPAVRLSSPLCCRRPQCRAYYVSSIPFCLSSLLRQF